MSNTGVLMTKRISDDWELLHVCLVELSRAACDSDMINIWCDVTTYMWQNWFSFSDVHFVLYLCSFIVFAVNIATLTLTKSSIAQTANSFPRLHNIDIVYIISSSQLPRLPHTALTVLTFDVTVMMIFSSDDEFESLRKLNRQRVMKLFLYCEYSTWGNW